MNPIEFIKNLGIDWVVGIGVAILPFILPNKLLFKLGYALGKILTTVLRQKVGKSGEAVEKYFQGTVGSFVNGLNAGLDSDD
jgi:hypothetical protein